MQRRTLSLLVTAVFLLTGPATVVGVLPWWISGWRLPTFTFAYLPLQIAGCLLMAAALGVLLESFARFAWKGLGAPVPVFPTRHLVVSGLYRFVRNPMYVAVVSIVLGQALLFSNVPLLEYAAALWVGFHLFVLAYEEPTLRRTFGSEYRTFCANVPRWLPRFRAWAG